MQRENVSLHSTRVERPARQDYAGAIWLLQAFSGILLIPLLVLHMVAHHFVVEGGLREFEQVIDYISNPAIFVITLLFLVVVTVHAAYGVRAILIDLRPSAASRRVINWVLLILAVAAIIYGIWLEITIANL